VGAFVDEANMISAFVIFDAKKANVNINYGKSSLTPDTKSSHLGFDIDTQTGMFTVPQIRWTSP
jgi:hypothetical protein